MKSREVLRRLATDGWAEALPRRATSHRQLVHPTKPGKVTVAIHGNRELSRRDVESIRKQAQIDKERWDQL